MIKKFEQYFNEMDPYGEENWDGNDELVKVGDHLYNFDNYIGTVIEIKIGNRISAYKIREKDGRIRVFSDEMLKRHFDQGTLNIRN